MKHTSFYTVTVSNEVVYKMLGTNDTLHFLLSLRCMQEDFMKKTNRVLAVIFVFSMIMNCFYGKYLATGWSFIFFMSAEICAVALVARAIYLIIQMKKRSMF